MFGISRQAFYKRKQKIAIDNQENEMVLTLVKKQRREQYRLGTRKVFQIIKPKIENMNIKMGRDKFFSLLRNNGMLVRRRKSFHITTNSNHRFRKYRNLIKGKTFTKPEQVWVSDITYIKTEKGHLYLSLITDLYSKKIMGHYLSNDQKTESSIKALRMALKKRIYPDMELIHHSDRGFQYCAPDYTKLLGDEGIQISMTESSDPYDNSVAERVNGILKDEYGIGEGFINQSQATKKSIIQLIFTI